MPLILNIDTATDYAGVCISSGDTVLGITESTDQKNHASFIQPAIRALCEQLSMKLSSIDAVAVTAGPGSYTGLRVGMATAKGICYALQKPLIQVGTLEVMAQGIITAVPSASLHDALVCPLIDARRMEVFTATYDAALNEIMAPRALIIDEKSFFTELEKGPVFFCGSGADKLRQVVTHPHAQFPAHTHTAAHLAARALTAYQSNRFTDLAYSEPLYVKEFFTHAKIKSPHK